MVAWRQRLLRSLGAPAVALGTVEESFRISVSGDQSASSGVKEQPFSFTVLDFVLPCCQANKPNAIMILGVFCLPGLC